MASLCHPGFTTTKLSYRLPIFETSATALCGTTGTHTYKIFYIYIYLLNIEVNNAASLPAAQIPAVLQSSGEGSASGSLIIFFLHTALYIHRTVFQTEAGLFFCHCLSGKDVRIDSCFLYTGLFFWVKAIVVDFLDPPTVCFYCLICHYCPSVFPSLSHHFWNAILSQCGHYDIFQVFHPRELHHVNNIFSRCYHNAFSDLN